MKKQLQSVTGGALMLISTLVNAGSYQTEVEGGFLQADLDHGKINATAVNGRFFFKPVSNSAWPWAESEFIQRSSWAGLDYYYINTDPDGADDVSEDGLGVSGRYIVPENEYVFGGELQGGDDKSIEVYGGLYLNQQMKYDTLLLFGYNNQDDQDIDTVYAHLKMLIPHKNGRFVNGEALVELEEDDGHTLSVTGLADFYFNRQTSAGGFIGLAVGEADGFTTGIRAQHFFNEQVAIYGEAGISNFDDNDVTTIEFGAKGRF